MTYTAKLRDLLTPMAVALFTAMLAFDPSGSLTAAKDAMALAGNAVIPALFPFFVCSDLLIALDVTTFLSRLLTPVMRPLFRISGGGALALVLGLISGYPTGARTAAGLVEAGAVTKEEGERLLAFCNNSGPLFILGAVGAGMLKDASVGLLLYLAHFLSSITVGVLLGLGRGDARPTTAPPPRAAVKASFGELLGGAIKKAAETVFVISGYVIIFNILIYYLNRLRIIDFLTATLSPLTALFRLPADAVGALVCGLLEPTNGARAASALFGQYPVPSLALLSAAIGWAGVSVHLQVLSIISKAGLSPRRYFAGKLLQAAIAPVYTLVFAALAYHDRPVFYSLSSGAFGAWTLGGLLIMSVYYVMLGLAAVLIFTGLSWTAALLLPIKNRRGAKFR